MDWATKRLPLGRAILPLARLATLALALGFLLPPSPARAYQVEPMIYDLKPAGAGAATIVRVRNDETLPLTIEMVVEKRRFDENGVESRIPADDDFLLFPLQAVIQPGRTQAIRVQYIGPPNLAASETYLVTVKQVPVELPEAARTGVQMVFNFSTQASIVPDGAKPQVDLAATSREGGDLVVRLRNSGTRYANIATSRLSVGGKTLEGEAWRQALRTSWLLPGTDRVIRLAGVGEGEVAFEYVDAGS